MLRRYAAFLLIPALLLVAAGASAQGGQTAAAKPAVPQADLDFAKTARVEAFPATFGSLSQTLASLAQLEYYNRPRDYYDTLRANYEKVTVADLKRVAQKWLRPDKMVIMVAGMIDECTAGADKSLPNQATIDAMATKFGGRTMDGLAKKYGDGTVHVVTLK
jgi:hypothetical protein